MWESDSPKVHQRKTLNLVECFSLVNIIARIELKNGLRLWRRISCDHLEHEIVAGLAAASLDESRSDEESSVR